MMVPTDRKFLKSHEWHKLDGSTVTIGITQHAADELTDVTYVDLPKVGARVHAGKPFGVIESVKATSDLYCGVDGEVVEVNSTLSDKPEQVNSDPHGAGWMIKVKASRVEQLDALLSPADYRTQLGQA